MKQSEIKEMTTEEIVEQIGNKEISLSKMKLTHRVSEMENPLTIRHARKDLARLKTELTKRELNK
ncbi:MAG: 50S ribosomal protein L29 [Bacteroidia bacterium]